MWTLVVCLGISWAGCGSYYNADFPSEESCYRALKEMKSDINSKAFCIPKKEK